jgi:hypothetical protein
MKYNWFLLLFILLFNASCKKDKKPANENQMCISVTDASSGSSISGASVSAFVRVEDQSYGISLEGTSNPNGTVCLDYSGYYWLEEMRVTKQGYADFCKMIPISYEVISSTYQCFMKRSGSIKFHLVNQIPVYSGDRLIFNISAENSCYDISGYEILGASVDSTITINTVSGLNSIYWRAERDFVQISDTSFNVTIPPGDTTFVEINY